MDNSIAGCVLQWGGILIEASLALYLVRNRGRSGRAPVILYLISLLIAQLTRVYILYEFGLRSWQYFYVYWSTDVLLVVSAFMLVCLFFRRACRNEPKIWGYVRLLLAFAFVLAVGISGLIFCRNYSRLVTEFVIEFNQNLYFSCLVLNTLLYLFLQYIESTDDQLGLLVCGMGIQFAGPAATMALLHLTAVERFAATLNSLVIRLCTLGMLLVWAYAITRVKEEATRVTRREAPALAEVTASSNV